MALDRQAPSATQAGHDVAGAELGAAGVPRHGQVPGRPGPFGGAFEVGARRHAKELVGIERATEIGATGKYPSGVRGHEVGLSIFDRPLANEVDGQSLGAQSLDDRRRPVVGS
ncbi:MAG: hypothetical protein KA200_01680, partial [Burkholderiales bacterium]|nr:hypothetical protein [Burkholderiales bacterium]